MRNAYSVLLDEASDSESEPRRNSLRTIGIKVALFSVSFNHSRKRKKERV